jgi:glucokinase
VACEKILLGDIGGTTARFAVLTGDILGPVDHLPVSQHRSMAHAVEHYLASQSECGRVGVAILGVAGPIENGRCTLVNSQWVIDAAELQAAFGFNSIHLINDFEATAYALPSLGASDVKAISGGKPLPGESMAVIGPGTGLGMAGVIRRDGRLIVVPSEGAHATLPGMTSREDAVIAHMRGRFDHVSAERALSGRGLENLYEAIAAIDGITVGNKTAAEITQSAIDRSCPVSVAAVDMFCVMLGTVAGDLALIFRARSGVYIAGGIAPRIVDLLARPEFRARFVAKGRFRYFLEDIPVTVIVNPDPAFVGLKTLALELSERS